MRLPDRLGFASLALAGASLLAGLLLPREGEAADELTVAPSQIMPSTVLIVTPDKDPKTGEIVGYGIGSGTIISADGSILTNAHVVLDLKATQAANEWKTEPLAMVLMFYEEDKSPRPECFAVPSHGFVLPPPIDLALLKCELDKDKNAGYAAHDWPALPVASADNIHIGDRMFIFGYPGVGSTTITMTSGEVSGFNGKVDEQGNPAGEGRGWIKTSTAIAGGNSGGTAVNISGELIGVPTRFHAEVRGDTTAGKLDYVRSIFIPEAQQLVAKAKEGWSPSGDDTPAAASDSEAVTVAGVVRRADNHDPIEKAVVVILNPGVHMSDVHDQDDVRKNALSVGITDANGEWVSKAPIPRGKHYTVIVASDGYRLLSGDDVLDVPADWPASKTFVPFGGFIELAEE